jgi:Big-like domain-containing protein/beta-propeller repeat-containing protein
MRSLRYFSVVMVLLGTLVLAQSISQINPPIAASNLSKPDPATQARVVEDYGKLPLSFEANHGQTDLQVKFLSSTSGYSVFLTGDEAVLTLSAKEKKNSAQGFVSGHRLSDAARGAKKEDAPSGAELTSRVLRMKLRNANSAAKVTGLDQLAGASNYFIGNDPAKWRTNVPNYAKVKYENIYNGIDLVYYGNQRQLEYDFIVSPGADPHRIAFNITGANKIRRTAQGDLVFQMSNKMGEDEVRWHKPVVYQQKDGTRQEIAAHYAITDKTRVGFELAQYDATQPLYIDPLIYLTYLGGSGNDQGAGIAVDSAGNAYVTGSTRSIDFPTKNPLQAVNHAASVTAFVTKINATGSALVYSTYLGGSNLDVGSRIAVDGAGNAYVTGYTESTDFPTTPGAFQRVCSGSCGTNSGDAFVAKINPTGSALVYSTYLGGSGADGGFGIAVDSAGNAYVGGFTQSANFPTTTGAFQTVCNGGSGCGSWGDAFVTKINPTGSALVYSTFLGGSAAETGVSIAVDSAGNGYVTGATTSTNFPTKNPLQGTKSGGFDGFVTKINATGSALAYSTYLGGSSGATCYDIATDSSGSAYVTGANFCVIRGCGNQHGFVVEINPAGSALVYNSVVKANYSAGTGIALDSLGGAYVIGTIGLNGNDPFYTVFVEKLDPAGSVVGSPMYLNGDKQSMSNGSGIATDNSGNAYFTGGTNSTSFPTVNALQPANAGGYDAFVAKIDIKAATKTTLTSSPNPSTSGQPVTFTAAVTSSFGAPADGETVSFVQVTKVIGRGTLHGGSASFTTSTLPVGTDYIKAVYGGDLYLRGSTSKPVQQVVN